MKASYSPLSATDNVSEEIYHVLDSLGLSRGLQGYDHVAYAIHLIMKSGKRLPVSKILYPDVAEAFNSTPTRVERSIRHAITTAFERSSTILGYFGESLRPDRNITNSQFIYTIASRLHRESLAN